MNELIQGIYTDSTGVHTLIPLAVDADGKLLMSGGTEVGSGTSITQAEVKAAIESATNLDQLELLLGNLGSYTDGLESLNTTLNAYVDGVEMLEIAIRDRLNAVNFATEALQTSGNNSLGSIDAKLTALINRIQNPGSAYSSKAIGTRAPNITAYTTNDVYGSLLEFQNIGAPGGMVTIKSLQVIFNMLAVPSGAGMYLFLYNSPPNIVADNAAFSIPAVDRPSVSTVQPIQFTPALAIGGGSVVGSAVNINTEIKLAPNSTSLYGYLVCRANFTPTAPSETFSITVNSVGL